MYKMQGTTITTQRLVGRAAAAEAEAEAEAVA